VIRALLLALALVSAAEAKTARTTMMVTCAVLPKPAPPVIMTQIINGVTFKTITY